MSKTRTWSDDNRAVSPVIGVILGVTITVILAAVVGTFVLGLGENVETNIQAGATVDCDVEAEEIKVIWTSNENANNLEVEFSDGVTTDTTEIGAVGDSYTATVFTDSAVDVTITGVSGEQRDVVQTDNCDLT